jgi:hypothetical protein
MARMGHDSMNAAIIYQHATRQADRSIASAMDVQLRAGGERGNDPTRGRWMLWFPREDRSMIVRGPRIMRSGAAFEGGVAPDSALLQRFSRVERVTGIEPALSAWELFELMGVVLGSLRVSRPRVAWSVPWTPAVMAR